MKAFLLLVASLLGLSACAGPLQLNGVHRDISPAMINSVHPYHGVRVVWGGMILNTEPKAHSTNIEVLAFGVGPYGEPQRQSNSQGRFILEHPGFLDPADYSPGRWLSVVGTIGQLVTKSIGPRQLQIPTIYAEQLHLWPKNNQSSVSTHFNFGIGIQF